MSDKNKECIPCKQRKEAYTILNVTQDFLAGNLEYVDKRTYDHRISLCLNCPGNHFNAFLKICNICKCPVKNKALFKKSSCPKNYWGAEKDE